MEEFPPFLMYFLGFAVAIVSLSLKIVHSLWWKPKRLEKSLRLCGIDGNSYRLVYGDMMEVKKLMAQAASEPLTLNHSIAARVHPYWHQMAKKYGKIFMGWNKTKPRLHVADPGLIKQVLANKDGHFSKVPRNPLIKILVSGLSGLEGDQWAKRRKLINPAFHQDKIQGMLPAFLTSCNGLIEKWKKIGADSQGKFELDIAPEMQNLTSDVIARAAFGSSFQEAREIFALQKEQIMLAMDVFYSLSLPGSRYLPTKKNRRRYEIDDNIKRKLKEMILSKETAIRNGEQDDDLLSLLLQCQKQGDSDMTINDLMEECKLFYLAGQETTANWLTWAMIVLSMHQDWQEKARQEVLQVFGNSTPDFKDLSKLKIVNIVLQEVLRLYPSLVGMTRYTLQTTHLGEMTIPAGVEIVLPVLLIHHDPDYWGEDVYEFKPDRFHSGVSKAGKDDHVAFLPFSWGPRYCLGQNFAMMEAKLALSMILRRFSFDLSPSYTHAPRTLLTLQPQYGAPLILQQI